MWYSATDQQLLYSALRLGDIVEMKTPVTFSKGVLMNGKLRFFK